MNKVSSLLEGVHDDLMDTSRAAFAQFYYKTSMDTFDRVKRGISVKIDIDIGYTEIVDGIHNYVRGSNE